jgi:phospholipid/cholesterol/gamma-HCH transport system substrate-binding protein
MPKVTNEFKTGLMLVIVLIMLAYFIFAAGSFRVGGKSYDIEVLFSFISGLRTNAPVRLCGAEVGKIQSIDILTSEKEKTQIAVTIDLDEGARVKEDAKFYISTLGLMGEKYIEITSGSKEADFLSEGAKVEGEDPVQMEKLMSKAEVIADNLNETILSVKELSESTHHMVTKEEVDTILQNLEQTSENFKYFSGDVRRHPWKLIWRGSKGEIEQQEEEERKKEEINEKERREEEKRGITIEKGVMK